MLWLAGYARMSLMPSRMMKWETIEDKASDEAFGPGSYDASLYIPYYWQTSS